MSKRIAFIFFIVIIFSQSIFQSCVNSENLRKIKKDFETVQLVENQSIDVDSLINLIPSYKQICKNINKFCGTFNPNNLLPLENVFLYENSKQTAIVFGMYMADLGYARHFERVQFCMNELNAVQTLAQKLAVGEQEFKEIVPQIEQNLENKDTLYAIIDSLMAKSKNFLSDKERASLNYLFLSGFWLESGYIALNNCQINDDIKQQHLSLLSTILQLLNTLEDKDLISNLKTDLIKIETNKTLDLETINMVREKYILK